MKFLIDNAISPAIVPVVVQLGFEAKHVRDFEMQASEDEAIFEFAAKEGYIVVSADTDFGTLLALKKETKPSVILFRRSTNRHPKDQAELLVSNLKSIKDDLIKGAIVVFDQNRIRIRRLPIG